MHSFAYYADLHNGDPGCEHWKHQFFAWHRAMLRYFEDGLRSFGDPDVTVPYWDWSKPPSGKRYPIVFENNPAGVAAKYGRPIANELLAIMYDGERVNHDDVPTTNPVFEWNYIADLASIDGYENFAGTVYPNGGDVEHKLHDHIHGFYVDGKMGSTGTAALDPIFWSFHSFIDLIWWWRQQQKKDVVTCGECTDTSACNDCKLQGMPGTFVDGAMGPTLISEVLDTTTQLGYSYQHTPPGPVVATVMAEKYVDRSPSLAALSMEAPALVVGFDVAAADGPEGSTIIIKDVSLPTKLPYTALVYLHPADQPFKPADVEFRDKYLVGHYAMWINTHVHHESQSMQRDFEIAVPKAVSERIGVPSGGKMRATVAAYFSPGRMRTEAASAASDAVRIGGAEVKAR